VCGKPAEQVPDDGEEVDLLLPASKEPYEISAPPWKLRHVTIEPGAALTAPNKGESLKGISGNVWIKRGGRCYVHMIPLVGAKGISA
jgi:hypothetical protein